MKNKTTLIEDYAFLSDTQTGALVSRDGCIDWLCFPRFDSPACFASLLGEAKNGHWRFWPNETITATRRRYRGDTLILETEIETASGAIRLIDFMPPRGENPDFVRIVEGLRGSIEMQMELIIRFDYGDVVPWVRKKHGGLEALAGPDGLILRTPIETYGQDMTTVAEFAVKEGDRVPFVLTWFASHSAPPKPVHAEHALRDTEKYWNDWSKRCAQQSGPWRDAIMRSLIVLKGLTYAPTGGIVAAPTTSLPEEIGGVRNWDYRYCWLRDAAFTLFALHQGGYYEEARSWREWLLRAIAGSPSQMQILYGVRGERRIDEFELPSLKGYENSRPVRIGNAASTQFQLDVYGEIVGAIYEASRAGLEITEEDWRLQISLLNFLETKWMEPDEGIWEVRGPRRHFTHSKAMAWFAFERGVRMVEEFGFKADGHLEHWKQTRDQIHREVCERGYNKKKNAFTQFYGSDAMDASVLLAPLIGFLPADDERIHGTIAAVEKELVEDGFVLRYRPEEENIDGLPGRDGAFLPCSFWFASCLDWIGEKEKARVWFERLLALRNDLGLLAEEYDPRTKRQLGNFPQAFSHLAIITTAYLLGGKQSLPNEQGKTHRS
jgi:GH15 family glucan-1,4-alpha-glucosidase